MRIHSALARIGKNTPRLIPWFLLAVLSGCGSSSSAPPPPPSNPVPSSYSLSPANAIAGGPAFTLTVSGNGFVQGSTVQWNGSSRTTTYSSVTQLTAAISAADIATTGTANVSVVNPAPGGGTSAEHSLLQPTMQFRPLLHFPRRRLLSAPRDFHAYRKRVWLHCRFNNSLERKQPRYNLHKRDPTHHRNRRVRYRSRTE